MCTNPSNCSALAEQSLILHCTPFMNELADADERCNALSTGARQTPPCIGQAAGGVLPCCDWQKLPDKWLENQVCCEANFTIMLKSSTVMLIPNTKFGTAVVSITADCVWHKLWNAMERLQMISLHLYIAAAAIAWSQEPAANTAYPAYCASAQSTITEQDLAVTWPHV